MTEEIGFGFNGWGLLLLIISVFAWSVSHFLISLPKLDMTCRHVGFVSSVLIFIASGWKAGLIAIPVTIVCSFIGAAVVVLFRNSPKGKSFKTLRMIRIECLLVGNIGSITFGIILAYWLDSFSEMIVEGLVIAAFISIWEIISKDTQSVSSGVF